MTAYTVKWFRSMHQQLRGFTLIDDVLTINFGGEHVVVKPLIMDSDTTYVTRDRFDGLVQQLKKTMDTV